MLVVQSCAAAARAGSVALYLDPPGSAHTCPLHHYVPVSADLTVAAASAWLHVQVANANRKPGAWAGEAPSGSKEAKTSSGSEDVKANDIEHAEVPQTS